MKRKINGMIMGLVISLLMMPVSFANSENFKMMHKKRVETIREKVVFKGIDENLFPDNYYDVEKWKENSSLVFRTDLEDELTLLTWYLIKKNGYFEVIPLSEASLSPEYQRVNGSHQYTIYAPKNIIILDKEGHTYTEKSPELYGLVAYYFKPLGDEMPSKPVMQLVKFGPDPKQEEATYDKNTYELSSEYKQLKLMGNVPPQQPKTSEEFAQIFLYMGLNDVYEYSVNLPYAKFDRAISSESKDVMEEGFKLAKGKYPEYMSYFSHYSYVISSAAIGSNLKITLKNDYYTNSEITMMHTLFKLRTQGYINELEQEGKLSDQMTDWDKAKVLYEWVILHTAYDHTKHPASQTGFGQLDNGIAVCEGYTATYNQMCRLVGIDVQGVLSNAGGINKSQHIWTLADLDGTRVHIDTTWGEPVGENGLNENVNYDFFAQSTASMRLHHEWDMELFGK